MKKTAIIFLTIGIWVGLFFIFPFILGRKARKMLINARSISEFHSWPWIVLFLVSPVAGILMFFIKDEDLVNTTRMDEVSPEEKLS